MSIDTPELDRQERELFKRFCNDMEPIITTLVDHVAVALVELGNTPRTTELLAKAFDWAVKEAEGKVVTRYLEMAAERNLKPSERVQ